MRFSLYLKISLIHSLSVFNGAEIPLCLAAVAYFLVPQLVRDGGLLFRENFYVVFPLTCAGQT